MYDINKLKLPFTYTPTGAVKMKITAKNEDNYLAVDNKRINDYCLDHAYFIFARIITSKILLMGKKIPQTKQK